MIRLRALNQEASEESEGEEDIPSVTREAQEQHAFAQYRNALKFLNEQKLDDATRILRELLEGDILKEVNNDDSAVAGHPLTILKYSCLKNMGSILVRQEDFEGAWYYYTEASRLDSSDVMLWYHLGCVALNLNNCELARDAFLDGLQCSPQNWRCLDNVISVLYALQDYLLCFVFISRAFEVDPLYVKGLAIRDAILEECPNIISECDNYLKGIDIGSFDVAYDREAGKKQVEEAKKLKNRRILEVSENMTGRALKPVHLIQSVTSQTWTALGYSLIYQHKVQKQSLVSRVQLVRDEKDSPEDAQGVNGDVAEVWPNYEQEDEVEVPQSQIPAACEQQSEDGDIPFAQDKSDDNKGRKRRRNSLSFLAQWVWGGKRRSARVRSTVRREAEREESNVEEVLRRLMPPSLLPSSLKEDKPKDIDILKSNDDSMDTMDLYKLFENRENGENNEDKCDEKKMQEKEAKYLEEGYFGNEKEKVDVEEYITRNNHFDLIDLIHLYVKELCNRRDLTWSKELISAYLEAYKLMREHIAFPDTLNPVEERDWIHLDGWMTLLHEELSLDSWLQQKAGDNKCDWSGEFLSLPAEEIGYLEMICACFSTDHKLWTRIYWLKAHLYLNSGSIETATCSFEQLLRYLEQKSEESEEAQVVLINCHHNNIISKETVQQVLTALFRNQNLSEVNYLYEEERYEDLADILQETFNLSQQPSLVSCCSSADSCPERAAQLAMLMDALWHLKRYQDCFHWGEACCNEALHKYLNSEDKEQQKWATALEKLLAGMESCVVKAGLSVVSVARLPRLVQNLTHIVCHQLDAPELVISMPIESVNPWILLQQILQWEVEKAPTTPPAVEGEELPAYISILFTAHDFLSRRSWCCSSEGALLLHTVDVVVSRMYEPDLVLHHDKLVQGMEQVFYCLYGHPNKKSKVRSSLQDHGVPPVRLMWEHALKMYQFYQPRELPEFDSYRVSSITADVEALVKRIIDLIPPQCNPAIMAEKMKQYVEGQISQLPRPPGGYIPLPRQISAIYYLLGDYYFKNKEWAKAIQHYLLDVCVNPVRLDSWAGMALARGSQLETKLNSCEMLKSESEFLKQAACAQRCFKRSLEIDTNHSLLLIEYGSFVYMVHSFCSRLLKQETDSLNLEMFEVLENEKEEMLGIAVNCFTTANKVWYSLGEDSGLQDERWLHHYMLGKAAEKNNEKPKEYLDHYFKASNFLHINGASYSRKISYNNPQNMSVEALEVFYRIHASILKWLEQNEGRKPDANVYYLFRRSLRDAKSGPFMARNCKDFDGRDSEETQPKGAGAGRPSPPAAGTAVNSTTGFVPSSAPGSTLSFTTLGSSTLNPVASSAPSSAPSCAPGPTLSPSTSSVTFVSSATSPICATSCARETALESAPIPVPNCVPDSTLTSTAPNSMTSPALSSTPSSVHDSALGSAPCSRECSVLNSLTPSSFSSLTLGSTSPSSTPSSTPGSTPNSTPTVARKRQHPLFNESELMKAVFAIVQEIISKVVDEQHKPTVNYPVNEVTDMTSSNTTDCVRETLEPEESPPHKKAKIDTQDSSVDLSNNADAKQYSGFPCYSGLKGDVGKAGTEAKSEFRSPEAAIPEAIDKTGATDKVCSVVQETQEKPHAESSPKPAGCAAETETEETGSARRNSHESSTTLTTDTSGENTCTSDESSSSEDSSESASSSSNSSNDALVDNGGEEGVPGPSGDATGASYRKTEVGDTADTARTTGANEYKDFDWKEGCEELVRYCLVGLEECVLRFPQHYKSLYRLTHFYFRSKLHRDIGKCRDLLLGTYICHPSPGRQRAASFPGLFAERKNNNFFNGVWRIPVPEVDRGGSFASHMSRCVLLLMDVLRELRDHGMLLELCLQLRRTPDPDKKYLRDSEREQLSRQALSLAVQTLRARVQTEPSAVLVLDVYKVYQRILKHLPQKEGLFSSLLTDAYKKHVKVESADVELAVQFCQQELRNAASAAAAAAAAAAEAAAASAAVAAAVAASGTKSAALQMSQVEGPQSSSAPVGYPPAPTAKVSATQPAVSTGRPRGRPPGSGKAFQQQVVQAALQNAQSAQGLPSTFFNMHGLFPDTHYLTAAMKAKIPSVLDQNFALSMLQAQMNGYQAEFLRHFAAGSLGSFSPVTSNLCGSTPSLTYSLNKANTNKPDSELSKKASDVNDYVKDRPNISITPVNPPSASNKPLKSDYSFQTPGVKTSSQERVPHSAVSASSSISYSSHISFASANPRTVDATPGANRSIPLSTSSLPSALTTSTALNLSRPKQFNYKKPPSKGPEKTLGFSIDRIGISEQKLDHVKTDNISVSVSKQAHLSDYTDANKGSKSSRTQVVNSFNIARDITLTSKELSKPHKIKSRNLCVSLKNKGDSPVSIHPLPVNQSFNYNSGRAASLKDEKLVTKQKDNLTIVEVPSLKATSMKRCQASIKKNEESKCNSGVDVEVITLE